MAATLSSRQVMILSRHITVVGEISEQCVHSSPKSQKVLNPLPDLVA